MQIEPLTGHWIVLRSNNTPVTETISELKDVTLSLFCKPERWPEFEQNGYQCIQVDIEFKPTK